MIDILFIGTILSYLQYNKYIDNYVLNNQEIVFSRYQLIQIYLYQYINALLILVTIIYCIYILELILIGVKKQYNLVYILLEYVPHYKIYFINNNSFLHQFMLQFFMGLIFNYCIITLLIILRGSSEEKSNRIIKQDLILFTLISFIINILLYVFL